MSGTDWESKFSSIVRDTETNLERVKSKLGSTRSSAFSADSGLLPTSYSSESTVRSQSAHHESRPLSVRNSAPETALSSSPSAELAYVPYDKSPSLVMLLNEKLDMQSKSNRLLDCARRVSHNHPTSCKARNSVYHCLKRLCENIELLSSIDVSGLNLEEPTNAIDQVMKTIQRNEEDRDSYSRQVHDLREEVTRLRSRIAERGVDLLTEQKIARLQQEWTAEMQSVHMQIQSLRHRNEDLSAKNGALSTSLLELQRFVSTEVDHMRRELNTLKNKTDSISASVSNVPPRRHDLEQRETDYNLVSHPLPLAADGKHSVSFLPTSYSSQSASAPNFSRYPANSNDIDLLRSEYKAIQKKLKSLEADFLASMNTGHKSRRRHRASAVRYTSESNDPTSLTASELDISSATNFTGRLRERTSATSFDDEILPSTDAPSDLSSDNEYSLSLDNL